jgi:hypothetical protein
MKKRIFVNPAVYIVFVIAAIGLAEMVRRMVSKPTYVNLGQEIATYFMTVALFFRVIYLRKFLIYFFPIDYNNETITIKRIFRKKIKILYQDITKVEFHNRYDQLIITYNQKKYRFSFLLGMDDFKKLLKKKVSNVEF